MVTLRIVNLILFYAFLSLQSQPVLPAFINKDIVIQMRDEEYWTPSNILTI